MRIIQPNSWSCLACVAAMATGTTLNEFMCYVEHDGSAIDPNSKHPEKRRGFYLQELLRYLLYHGLYAGASAVGLTPVEGTGEVFIKISTRMPAMLQARSRRIIGCDHVMYWDGIQIMDPSQAVKDNPPFDDYFIKEWWPIMEITK